MVNSAFVFKRSAATCAAKLAAREISSYDELVHEPINPTSTLVGQLFFAAASFICEIGVAKSGVKGPFKCGSNSDMLISITWSKYFSGFLYTSGSAGTHFLILLAKAATSARPVARRSRSMEASYPKVEVVAPISAPMLQIVPLPVQLMEAAPSPKYSTMQPVPPFTVRMPATFKITSLGEDQPVSFPVSFTPIILGNFSSQGISAITSTASAPPTPIATIPKPPAFTVCESVPIIRPPGKA